MPKYHINKKGKVEECKATVRACPFGEENHIEANSPEDALNKFDEKHFMEELGKQRIENGSEWDDFDKFLPVVRKYLQPTGEGDTQASQAVTAVNKLVYKCFNDGDVFDNTGNLDGWVNDLSDCANWLDKNIPEAKDILNGIHEVNYQREYEELLYDLATNILNEKTLSKYEKPKEGTIYDCEGTYKFDLYKYDDEDDEW